MTKVTEYQIKSPKKLIEVALPLEAINIAGAAEKLVKVGKPTNLHLWWARRPLAAARAILFSQLVNDPGFQQGNGFKYGMNKRDATEERKRLFKIIEDLVQWDNTSDEEVLGRARAEIRRSWREVCDLNKDHPDAATLFDPAQPPAMHDPFAGGGVIPLEAQRLGLESHASDLNPVAVLINKALIDLPQRFAGRPPVGPRPEGKSALTEGLADKWTGAAGLAEDIQIYGAAVVAKAQARMGRYYGRIPVTKEIAKAQPELDPLIGTDLTVIAWLWARTVKSPNPAFSRVDVPLVASFVLSTKPGKEVYVKPFVRGDAYTFKVVHGKPTDEAAEGTKSNGRGANFRCLVSGAPIGADYIRNEAKGGRMGQRLLAVVAEGKRGRIFLSPSIDEMWEDVALSAKPTWQPNIEFFQDALGFRIGNYGMSKWSDLFTDRQLMALGVFCDVIKETQADIAKDAADKGYAKDEVGLETGGDGARAYAEAITVYLSLAMSRMADWGNSLCRWESKALVPQQLFGRQAIPMVWDFCEANPLSNSTGSYSASLANIKASFTKCSAGHVPQGHATQADAQTQRISRLKRISTDPPYYDNIGYADLSDFFYVWLRHSLKDSFPVLFSSIAVPKMEELVATPERHGGADEAERFFLDGMTNAISGLASQCHPDGPITIYYAFKQSETNDETGTTSKGWVAFLEAIFRSGLMLTGTWPMRMENSSRMRGQGSNALASSIVLVCRKRAADAKSIGRRDFLRELNAVLPEALDAMTRGGINSPVAPVDLSQAIIGPGMAVFSKYASVLEADGSPMCVRTALQLINRFLTEDDFDADTYFCLQWFEQYGWETGKFGEATVLAQAKGTSVEGVKQAGVLESGGGNVRLFKWAEYPTDWDPRNDNRLPIWEATHHLIRVLRTNGEAAAGQILAAIPNQAEACRQLAYRLYTLCERSGRSEDARAYNELIGSWAPIEAASIAKREADAPKQTTIFDN